MTPVTRGTAGPRTSSSWPSLGLGAYRFSLEWSRIEPDEGEWSVAALEHYRRQCARCHELGLVPGGHLPPLHHPPLAGGARRLGGADAPERFARFCERAAQHLGDLVGWACTINEPNVVAIMGYLLGVFPPAVRDVGPAPGGQRGAVPGARLGVEALRGGPGDFPVGLTLSMTDSRPCDGGEERLDRMRRSTEDVFLEATAGDDFVGVQCYTRMRVGPDGRARARGGRARDPDGLRVLAPGPRGHGPPGLGVHRGTPVVVTENGIGTADDAAADRLRDRGPGRRAALPRTTGSTSGATSTGACSTTSSGSSGYGPTFGLVEVDRATFERRPKPSAAWFGAVARANAVP